MYGESRKHGSEGGGEVVRRPRLPDTPAPLPLATLDAVLERITYANEETGYTVARVTQGSEYPCVVVPLTTSAWLMLQRNLLYTAVTRAKRLVVLVGSKRAIARAVRTEGAGRCYAALAERLRRGQRQGSGHPPA